MTTADPTDIAGRLPTSMRFGVATSSHQIEGATQEDGRGPSIWDTFTRQPGTIADGSTGDEACDHYHRMPEDVALLADLGVDAYRFSIAWPRIQPSGRGQVEQRGLDFYDRLVDALLAVGIQPLPTLYHWDLPQQLEDEGGWPERDLAGRFADYAHVVVDRLGDRVQRWATLNEPWCSAHLGYHAGDHAPGRSDPADAMAAAYTLLRAHHLGRQAIVAASSDAQVGIALNVTTIRPRSDTEADHDAVRALDAIRNRWWLDGVLNGRLPADALAAWESVDHPDLRDDDLAGPRPEWLGINYYYPEFVTGRSDGDDPPDACAQPARLVPPEGDLTDMGWRVDPTGLTELLIRIHHTYGRDVDGTDLPIVITENGSAYPDPEPMNGRVADPRRTAYLANHLAALADATDAGVPVDTYLAWSAMDNFEWALGYQPRFGIVHVDYDTQVRTPKDSARWYSEMIREHASRR